MLDQERLETFVFKMLNDLGAAQAVPLVRMGDALGLWKALAETGPTTPGELAAATGCAERYIREWLSAQAAAGYVEYDAEEETFSLSPEQAMVFADEDSPVYLMGAFDLAASLVRDAPLVEAAFRTGEGVAYDRREGCLFCAMRRFFRTGYRNDLLATWLPALDGMVDRLGAGAKVADVGCGHGVATIMMAEAFPASAFVGYDFHADSIEDARRHAEAHGVQDRLRFEVADAQGYEEGGFDLITFFDTLHDLGDPVGAARQARRALKEDGALMVVEPIAGDRLEENINPVGRLYYSGSTMVCVPASLAQDGRAALGAQAGEARLTEVLREAGFSRVRRAATSPFNMVLEARP